MLLTVTRPMQASPEKAAITPVYLATSSEVAGVTGRYYAEGRPKELSGLAANAKLARRLWAVSAQALVPRTRDSQRDDRLRIIWPPECNEATIGQKLRASADGQRVSLDLDRLRRQRLWCRGIHH